MATQSATTSSPIVSEVAYFRKQQALTEEAAARALNNGAVSAPHEFVAHNVHKELVSQVGQDQAMQLLFEQVGWTPEEIAAAAAVNQSVIDAAKEAEKHVPAS